MEELYQENAHIVYHFLYCLTHDEKLAEDLTQETFLKAYQSLQRFDGSCKISTWLCQIGKHLLYQQYSKHKKEILGFEVGIENEPVKISVERQVYSRIELLEVLKDMQSLPIAMREVMYLRITGDLSFREIGEILGKSENWARVNFYRGKKILLKERKWNE